MVGVCPQRSVAFAIVLILCRPAVVLVGGAVTGCASHEDDGTRVCTEMRDHLVELRLAESSGPTDERGQPLDLAPHRAAMKQALGADFIKQCQRDMSRAQTTCVLSAATLEVAKACSKQAR
jgi:hypothetical protein